MDVLILILKLPILLAILLVIYLLPISVFLASSLRLVFGYGARKWLALACLFSLPLSVYLLINKVRPFTFTSENTMLYLGAGLTLIAAFFWYKGVVQANAQKLWLETTIFILTGLIWLIFMLTTTKWIVG